MLKVAWSSWGFPKLRGTLFGGPHNKDYSILGSILGSTILGNYHLVAFHKYGDLNINAKMQ